ncbi:hypothetical protein D3C71_1379860 [compost metagenome]
MASWRDEPPSRSARIVPTSLAMRGFLWPLPMISSELTIGTPDFIMVAIWRLKKAISLVLTGLPALPNKGLGLGLTTVGVIPKRRSSALSRLMFLASCSPFIFTPRLSVPSQTNGCIWLVLRPAVSLLIALRVTAIFLSPSGHPQARQQPHGSWSDGRRHSLTMGFGGTGHISAPLGG